MADKPYKNSTDIINDIKRDISVPLAQQTFSEDDLLSFVNEEMDISMVPSVLEYHEEYFVTKMQEGGDLEIPLEANKSRYQIPPRAIGMRLRDLFFKDDQGNLSEMVRINPDDQGYFEYGASNITVYKKFFIEGNDVQVIPDIEDSPRGSLVMTYYLRPNRLVKLERAGFIQTFDKTVTITNANIVAEDTLTISGTVFTAKSSGAGSLEFNIGADATETGDNLANSINNSAIASAVNTAGVVTISFNTLRKNATVVTNNETAFTIPATLGLVLDAVPTNISTSSKIDLLRTKSGHRTLVMSISIVSISGTTVTVSESLVPDITETGDHICQEYECVIPQIPSDLHISLIQRSTKRILQSLGDYEGVADAMQNIAEIDKRQGSIIDNRVEGSPAKVLARRSVLRFQRYPFRRYF